MLAHGESASKFDAGPRHRIVARLGEGSFGAVYEAVEIASGRRVALKTLAHAKPGVFAQFKREFRALAEVRHLNLVGLRELYEHNGVWVIAMELVEGSELLTWVAREPARENDNASPPFDEGRLRAAFGHVAQGLSALHAHRLLHRDLKPSNVRVTSEGRAVLLDFGLVTSAERDAQTTMRGGAGTAAYMAPEQAGSQKISAAADWYAFGVCLFEALTRRLPFDDTSAFGLLLQKTKGEAPAPRRFCEEIPEDLDALCSALLARDPEARPRGPEILRVLLGAEAGASPHTSSDLTEAASTAFEGRALELDALAKALSRTHEGELSLSIVEGESGIGKSALLREAVQRELTRRPKTWVLSGRCYEHERVPYKAFDGCMDALARLLSKLPGEECAALLPRTSGLLMELFPALRTVKAIGNGSLQGAPAEPGARRNKAFAVLSELLGRLAEERPIVLVIDDLQWADQESFRLLRVLVEDHPPPILLACTVRPRAELSLEVRAALDEVRSWSAVEWLSLSGLGAVHTTQFAEKLLGARATKEVLLQIAYESKGHPMLITELARYALSHELRPGISLTLDAALSARIDSLSPIARRLLELVALSGKPHAERVFERALNEDGCSDAVTELLAERLLRRNGALELTPTHDRVREVTVKRVAQSTLPGLHRTLAQELLATGEGEPSELAYHWDRAGDAQLALDEYRRAADHSLEALAFARAAEFYGRALELLGGAGEASVRAELMTHRAQAFVGLGKSADAAELFAQAAELVDGNQRIQLRVWAAQHQIQSAQLDAGLSSARAVLGELKVPLPGGSSAALARIVWERLRVGLRRYDIEPSVRVNVEDKQTLDAMAALMFPVSWADFLPGNALNMHHLRRALDVGEPGHAARALCHEAAIQAMVGNMGRCEGLLEAGSAQAARAGEPVVDAYVRLMRGTVAAFRGHGGPAARDFAAAEELLVTSCPGEGWLLTNVRMALSVALYQLGEYRRMTAAMRSWLQDARERRDAFAVVAYLGVGHGFMEALVRDAPDELRESIAEAMTPWRDRPFGFAQHGEVVVRGALGAYTGSVDGHQWLLERTREHDKAFVHRAGVFRNSLLLMRGLAGLASYATDPGHSGDSALVLAERVAAQLSANRGNWAPPFGQLILCQAQALRGKSDAARRTLKAAREELNASTFAGMVTSLNYLDGVLEGGDAGRGRSEAAIAFYRERGFRDPWRAATMFVPAARLLEGSVGSERRSDKLIHGRYYLIEPGAAHEDGFVHALDTRTGRAVTLRSLASASPEAIARFKQAFRLLQGVHHENLVQLEALLEYRGSWTIVMERVPATDFLSFVRPSGLLDLSRLRAALSGVLKGLSALHAAGFVHRDLRPANIRVTSEGRAVLIALGLLTPIEKKDRASADVMPGDLAYIAPEQMEGTDFSVPADVYAIGVCLYEALTGQLPFDSTIAAMLLDAKRRARPVPPWALRIEVPAELEELCLAMLERSPADRPTVEEAEARLAGERDPKSVRDARRARLMASLSPRSLTPGASKVPFVGRRSELTALAELLTRSAGGACLLGFVRGESGVGKSALLSEVLERWRAQKSAAFVVRSRCHGSEQLPYQAFDGAVDELARVLRKLPHVEVEAMLPPKAALLAQLFPVLSSVPAISGAPKKGLPAEPNLRRAVALDAFVRFLSAVSERQPLVIAIDDLEWADGESFRLLRALLEHDAASRIAVVATLGKSGSRDARAAPAIEQLKPAVDLTLGTLDEADARALTLSLMGSDTSAERLEAMARESAGHPLFMRELAIFALNEAETATPDLARAIEARLERLSDLAHRLLELVALSARPCPAHVLERASGAELGFDAALRSLFAAELVRQQGEHGIVCIHDRLRLAVLSGLNEAARSELAAFLAEALDAEPDADPVERARLWDTAGETGRASKAYAQAGRAALEVLAFHNAEALFGRAVELCPAREKAELGALLGQRAQAFAGLGRSTEAAELFAKAAQCVSGPQRARFTVCAAQHQIQSAQLDAGMASARAVLSELGVPLPTGSFGLFSRLALDRAQVSLRRYRVAPRTGTDEHETLVLDAMAALMFPVSWVDFLPGSVLNMHHVRRALALGEPGHAARALSHEATIWAMLGNFQRSRDLFERGSAQAARAGDPAAFAYLRLMRGSAAVFQGQVQAALSDFETAEEILVTCPGEAWLLTNVRTSLGVTLHQVGEHRRLMAAARQWRSEAEGRQDAFAAAALLGLGHGVIEPLMRDAADEAIERFSRAMEPWRRPSFGLIHHGEAGARAWISAYLGDASAHTWFVENKALHERAFMHRSGVFRDALMSARCVCALSAYDTLEGSARDEALAYVDRHVRKVSDARATWGGPFKDLMRAQLLALRGAIEPARACAQRSFDAYSAMGLPPFAFSAEYLLSLLEGGPSAATRRAAIVDFYRDQGWAQPWRAATMTVPAARVLEQRT